MSGPDPEKIRRKRQERGLSQDGLAALCGLSRKTVQRMEAGLAVQPATVAFVASALGVAAADLAGRGGADPHEDDQRLGLRRITSGKQVFQQLARTSVGRVDCDVDTNRQTLEPVSRLVTLLQGLVRERWDAPAPPTADLPMVERLRVTAAINDDLHGLQALGIGLYMGHYYRYAAPPAGASPRTWETATQTPLVITRLHLTQSLRERMQVRVDAEWRGAPEAFADPMALDDLFTAAGEATVFLYPTPPPRPAHEAPEGFIDGVFDVLRP